jgi:hypothetical protein
MSGVIKQQGVSGSSGSVSRNLSSSSFVGIIQPFAMSTAPDGWLACEGASISRGTYGALFAVIGTTWGTVDGNTFTLPNLKGAFLRGMGDATAQMGNTNVYQGGSIGAVTNDKAQDSALISQANKVKVGGPQYQGWFNGRTIGSHSMAFRTGVFYYDHNQGGTSQYVVNSFAPFNYSMASKGGTDATSGGTRRAGGETKPFSATVQYCVYAGAKGS